MEELHGLDARKAHRLAITIPHAAADSAGWRHGQLDTGHVLTIDYRNGDAASEGAPLEIFTRRVLAAGHRRDDAPAAGEYLQRGALGRGVTIPIVDGQN